MSKIPVLVIAFNRPWHIKKTMELIRAYRSDRLYLACDGARDDKDGESRLVEETRKTMMSMVNWPCKVQTLFQNKNLGCAYGPYTAITWFFEHEEYGIIIEDDVVVGLDFFKLCEDLLPRYAQNERIMEISAENHSGRTDISNTYIYSQFMLNWGWATWKRAWAKMDMTMSAVHRVSWMSLVKRLGLFRGLMMYRYFGSGYNNIENFDAWDTRWYLSILDVNGLIICPGVNLAVNEGMNNGVHYHKIDVNPYAHLTIGKLKWPIIYNDSFTIDKRQYHFDNKDFFRIRMLGLKKKIMRWWNT